MRGVVMHALGDVRVQHLDDPQIIEPTDAIIRVTATCVCGSDLWPYRGIEKVHDQPMGHEYVGGIPYADGTLVATPGMPDADLIPSLLAASDVLGTGWFGAVAAESGPGKTVAVVGDGAVGLLAVLAAKQLGAERIIAMSRHETRQKLATEFGATDIVTERGDEGVAKIKELTGGLGAHSVVEAVGTQESMQQAIGSARPGGHVGFVGVNHDVSLSGEDLFFSQVRLLGGPAPVHRFLPELIDLIWQRKINPGKVFDLTLPLEQAAEGYKAMDERRAIKALLRP
ncbi:zinc-binding dehydrogenase [Nonomuraea sp. SYSU D8015]|uniref:zinc-binding dehydrogenase n=1 Tax=Nonomuraea sp. SYSU D8015 TaxID=2593644 RepID=UPI0016614285|nr:zinc-binding dehydrogenase [Nonomuraea sp. SYSU D8015]